MESSTKSKYNLDKFIEFIVDLAQESEVFASRPEYGASYYFTHGGCYELYKIVKHYYQECECMVPNSLTHCAIGYQGKLYDATGEIDGNNYHKATLEDIEYMERSFGRNIHELEAEPLISEIDKCNVGGILY